MQVIKQGTCQFAIIEDVSKKTNNSYRALKVKIGDYELSNMIFLNRDQMFIIEKEFEKKQ